MPGRVVQLGHQQRHPARRAQAAAVQVVAARLHTSANTHTLEHSEQREHGICDEM